MVIYLIQNRKDCIMQKAVCKSTRYILHTFLVLYKYRSQVFVHYSVTSFSFRQVE